MKLDKIGYEGLQYMAQIAMRPSLAAKTAEIGKALKISQSGIRQRLAEAGLIVRLAPGLYGLTREPSEISVGEIFDAVGATTDIKNCKALHGKCDREPLCALRGFFSGFSGHLRQYLYSVSLLDVISVP